jgi:hypothetical protein
MNLPDLVMTHAVAAEEIAGLITFLVSEAAAPASGASLPACGGLPRHDLGGGRIIMIR